MIRRTALPALGLTVALLIAGAVYLGRSVDAPAQSSVLKDTVQQQLADADDVFVFTHWWYRDNKDERFVELILRADIDGRRLALEGLGGAKWRVLYEAGNLTYHSSGIGHRFPPIELDPVEPIVNALLTEIDAGLMNSTWSVEQPPPVDDAYEPGEAGDRYTEWWRIDLPGPYDDAFRVYIRLSPFPKCPLSKILVLDDDVDEVARLRHPCSPTHTCGGRFDLSIDVCGDIHWSPDFANPLRVQEPPFGDPMYRWHLPDRDEYGDF